MNKFLLYLVAIGKESNAQLRLCLQTIDIHDDVDIVVFTDEVSDFVKRKGLVYINANDAFKISHKFAYRVNVNKAINLGQYEGIFYLDCDFLFTKPLSVNFFNEDIFLCNAITTTIDSQFVNRNLTTDEIKQNAGKLAINSGAFYVPKKHFKFIDDWREQTEKYSERVPDDYCPEQTTLNSMFFRKEYPFQLFDKELIHFPANNVSKITSKTRLIHFAGLSEKSKLMSEWLNQKIKP